MDITERIQIQLKLEESAVRLEEYANQMESLANQRAAQLKDAERLAAIGATAGMVGMIFVIPPGYNRRCLLGKRRISLNGRK